jgi:hypothetical protein
MLSNENDNPCKFAGVVIFRSVHVVYVNLYLNRSLLLFDYCLLRGCFGNSSGSERRITEAVPKPSRSSHVLNNTKTRKKP